MSNSACELTRLAQAAGAGDGAARGRGQLRGAHAAAVRVACFSASPALEHEALTHAFALLSVANALVFLAAGCGVAFALSAALGGEATWSVSTGVGAALAAGVYEVGRPARLSGAQAAALDAQWVDFRAFADARLARKGRCHASEVETAYRRFSPAYNARRRDDAAANAAGDADLRNFIANWSPAGACRACAAVTSRVMLLRWCCAC